jgi:hypothetical protein
MRYFILDADRRQTVETTPARWEVWFAAADRTLRSTEIHTAGCEPGTVYTFFLGLSDRVEPMLWETALVHGDEITRRWRWRSRAVADLAHQAVVAALTGREDLTPW